MVWIVGKRNAVKFQSGLGYEGESAAIFMDRLWPFPGKSLKDLDARIRNAAVLFREVPELIKKGVARP